MRVTDSWGVDDRCAVLATAADLRLPTQCCCPPGKSLSLGSSRTNLQITNPCPWTTESSKIVKASPFCKQSVHVSHEVHKFGYCHLAGER